MIIIGLMGAAGAGKDTTADLIAAATTAGMARFAFADALRAEIAQAWGVDVRVLLDRSLRDVQLEQLALRRCMDAGFCSYAWELASLPGIKPRTLMQRWGDYRRAQDLDYFIAPAEAARVRARFDWCGVMVATDVRFPNEAAWVRRNGGTLWRIVRAGLQVTDSHVSEHATSDLAADATIRNDGTVDDLRRVVVDELASVVGYAPQ